MILAAGLGTRLRPLTELRAKPALPVLGRPVISLLLELLARHGIREVLVNLYHRPETLRRAVAADHPAGLAIHWSEEPRPLGTGGGLRRALDFLRGGPDCLVLAGDMLFDADLRDLVDQHRRSGRHATLLLREDSRAEAFGSIGLDAAGNVVRVGRRGVAGGATEVTSGLFTGVRLFSREAFTSWPEAEAFEDLRDWLIPGIESRGTRVGGLRLAPASSVWEPVGTPAEYLRVNLEPPSLPSLGGEPAAWAGAVRRAGRHGDVVVDESARVGRGAQLERCVVWDREQVPDAAVARDSIFAGGRFHPCVEPVDIAGGDPSPADRPDAGGAERPPERSAAHPRDVERSAAHSRDAERPASSEASACAPHVESGSQP